MVLVGVGGGAYYLDIQSKINVNNKTKLSQVAKPSNTPAITKAPAISPSPTSPASSASPQNQTPWQKYNNGQKIDGIVIDYPSGWTVNYKIESNLSPDYKAKERVSFDFAPAGWNSPQSVGWMGWGTMDFDVYEKQPDINTWATSYAPDNITKIDITHSTNIGGQPAYDLSSTVSEYGGTVVLGSIYSYQISYSQNGYMSSDNKTNFFTILESQIFPTIRIE